MCARGRERERESPLNQSKFDDSFWTSSLLDSTVIWIGTDYPQYKYIRHTRGILWCLLTAEHECNKNNSTPLDRLKVRCACMYVRAKVTVPGLASNAIRQRATVAVAGWCLIVLLLIFFFFSFHVPISEWCDNEFINKNTMWCVCNQVQWGFEIFWVKNIGGAEQSHFLTDFQNFKRNLSDNSKEMLIIFSFRGSWWGKKSS